MYLSNRFFLSAENTNEMNKVYVAAQFIFLPAARFTAVKKEQIEWLKKHNAAPSTEEKCKLMKARIKVLQKLVW
jgi:hypothetical protein